MAPIFSRRATLGAGRPPRARFGASPGLGSMAMAEWSRRWASATGVAAAGPRTAAWAMGTARRRSTGPPRRPAGAGPEPAPHRQRGRRRADAGRHGGLPGPARPRPAGLGPPSRCGRRRCARRLAGAGWPIPARYHRTPPPLDAAPGRPAGRPAGCGTATSCVSFDSGFSPRPEEPGARRWATTRGPTGRPRWRVLRHPGAPRPWLVCIHGFGTGTPRADFLAFHVARLHRQLGFNLALPVLPLHGASPRPALAHDAVLRPRPVDPGLAQAAWDVRRVISWIRSHRRRPDRLVRRVPGRLHGRVGGRAGAGRRGGRRGPGGRHPRPVRPPLAAPLARRPAPPDCWARRPTPPCGWSRPWPWPRRSRWRAAAIYAGLGDRFVPTRQAVALWEHWGSPELRWYPGGHVGFIWSPPGQRPARPVGWLGWPHPRPEAARGWHSRGHARRRVDHQPGPARADRADRRTARLLARCWIRTAAAGLCHSDLHFIEGIYPHPLPVVMGHESAGRGRGGGGPGGLPGRRGPRDHLPVDVLRPVRVLPDRQDQPVPVPRHQAGRPPGRSRRRRVAQFGRSGFVRRADGGARERLREDPPDMPLDVAALLGCGGADRDRRGVEHRRGAPGRHRGRDRLRRHRPQRGPGGLRGRGGAHRRGRPAGRQAGAGPPLRGHRLVDASDGTAVDQVLALTEGGVQHAFEAIGLAQTAQDAFAMLRADGGAYVIGMVPPTDLVSIPGASFISEKRIQGAMMGSNRFRVDLPRMIDLYLQGRHPPRRARLGPHPARPDQPGLRRDEDRHHRPQRGRVLAEAGPRRTFPTTTGGFDDGAPDCTRVRP